MHHHLRQVHLRRWDIDAQVAEIVPGFLEQLRRVEQRLGGEAADVEAGTAEGRPLLDHGDLHPQLRRADGTDVAARSRAEHCEVELVRHDMPLMGLSLCNRCAARWLE